VSEAEHGKLPRLNPDAYRGTACVHWNMTIHNRACGWLDAAMHARVRELLLHTMARHTLVCPVYCLMPDHGHFLWMGICDHSDQRSAARFFRRSWNLALAGRGARLQTQAYEHLLRDSERGPKAFESTAAYILNNPQRAGLVADVLDWPFAGSILPGYPDLPPLGSDDFWRMYWKILERERARWDGINFPEPS